MCPFSHHAPRARRALEPAARLALAASLVASLAGCAVRSVELESSLSAPTHPPSRDVITRPTLEGTAASTALEAIQRVHPEWLIARGGTTGSHRPRVYLDGAPYGEVQSLSAIPIAQVSAIRRLSMTEATMRFGTDHPGGIILVLTSRGTR